jgi:hypothetical protein
MLKLALMPVAAAAIMTAVSGPAPAMAAARLTTSGINAVLHAPTWLAQAVDAAEQVGGPAVSAAPIRDRGGYEYKVTIVVNGEVMDEYVGLASGKVVRSSDRGPITTAFNDLQRQAYDGMLTGSPTNLLDAITAAEKENGATAVAARLENKSESPRVSVELAKPGETFWRERAVVDLDSGKVVMLFANALHSKR